MIYSENEVLEMLRDIKVSDNNPDEILFNQYDLRNFHETYRLKYNKYGADDKRTNKKYNLLLEMIRQVFWKTPHKRHLYYVTLQISSTHAIKMTLPEFYVHLILWRVNLSYGVPIDIVEETWSLKTINTDSLADIFENVYRKYLYEPELLKSINISFNMVIVKVHNAIMELTNNFDQFAANGLNIYDLIKLADKDKDFNNLLYYKLDRSLSRQETENIVFSMRNKLNEVILNNRDSVLATFLNTRLISADQLNQNISAVGYRSDLDGVIIGVPIRDGYLGGKRGPVEYILDSLQSKQAIDAKDKHLAASGYISRKSDLLANGIVIDGEDCESQHYLEFKVLNHYYLSIIDKKYYLTDDGEFASINGKKDTHLIGKTLKLRSGITCKNPLGSVCKICYGNYSSERMSVSPGGLVSIQLTNPVSNRAMSIKHLVIVKSLKFENEVLDALFVQDDTSYTLRENEYKEIYIVFKQDYIKDIIDRTNDDISDAEQISTTFINTLKIRSTDLEKNVVEQDIDILNGQLEISDEIIDLTIENLKSKNAIFVFDRENDEAILQLQNIEPGTKIFNIVSMTQNVAQYIATLHKILHKKKDEAYTSFQVILSDILKLFETMNQHVELSTIEMMINPLTRAYNDSTRRPNFNGPEIEPYLILNLDNAIKKGNVYGIFGFEDLRRIFLDASLYTRNTRGIFESFFTSNQSTYRNMNKLHNAVANYYKKHKII